jgi:type VI secretion system FHA domain protein
VVIGLRLVRRPDGAEPAGGACPLAATGSTIGRAPECDLVLDDAKRIVSRRHAWLVPQGADQALLRCISTTAPLQVNGEALPPAGERLVRVGDRLRIGGFELVLEQREAVAVVALPPVRPVPTRSRPPRLDRWFDLDTVPDPLGPGSPLPALQGAGLPTPARQPGPTLRAGAELRAANPPRAETPTRIVPPAAAARSPVAAAEPSKPLQAVAAREPTPADRETLRQAFLRGAGLDAATPFTPGPAEMEHLGRLMRAATEGMLGLLRTRAIAESSLHGDGTRIVARENNPLKFVPDVMQALALLLEMNTRRGFLDPVEAVRDAHDELQVHQLAMLAGMRAAVFDLISQLGPDAAEASPARGLSQRLPALRDAALWRRHRQGHARLLENLDDVLDSTFGREFLRAYDAQSKRAEDATPPPDEGDRTVLRGPRR